jgi:primosomal protein N'
VNCPVPSGEVEDGLQLCRLTNESDPTTWRFPFWQFKPDAVSEVKIEDLTLAPQMLIESPSRMNLQRFLAQWLPALHDVRKHLKAPEQRILRWAVDVDPLSI